MNSYLTVESLHVNFENHAAVNDLSFSAERGEFLTLLGPSGCGKTTTLRAIAGFVAPAGGKIRVAGQDITELPPHRRNIGMVFQSYALFPHLTVTDNVGFGLRMRHVANTQRHSRVARALEMVGLAALGGRYPAQLSGGQQQRVAIARSLVNRPALLLADEPTGNLDSQTSIEIMGVFQKLNDQGMTIIMVTHELDVARYTKRMVILRDGKILTDEKVAARLNAEQELAKLKQEQKSVQLA
jgi:putative spermidine/putrescine transport system ATP-binding protein